ncbi:MAG: branched-chain amino acid aminotransferase, partial [Planctomycetes bacterium]|nr:branched-chain amino acid aminotransferase [Planctomycetota bacterium]
MTKLVTRLMNDEAGFVVSSELVLVATIGVLAML